MLVIGAGPSGLSAAYHLARLGHEVEIRDAGAEPGGMMRYGIPAYRLPRDVLDGEIDRIAALGVRMTCDHRVEDLEAERDEGGFDAVFVAVGAHLSKRVDIPARDAGPIVDAVSFLRSVASGERPVIGRRVAVYGGGNTAMDAARVARRLGADEALIVYRRTREQMPAHEEEAEDAEREGVRINWLRTITAFEGPELQVEVMELDESGYPQPTGRFETLAADTVILALGQETDTAFLRAVPGVEFERDGTVQVSTSLMTGCPGVFAGGDMVPSERTVTVGVGHGKKAARHIDAWLRGAAAASARRSTTLATFDKLHLWYFGDAARRQQPELAPDERDRGLRRGGRRSVRRGGDLRGEPVPVVRQLLRVRRLPRRVPGGRGHQARRRAPLPVRLRPLHGLRGVLRAVPGARDRDVPGAATDARDDRRQRGGGVGRLPAQRGLLHLPDHAVLADGRAGRRVGQPGAAQRLGHRARGGRDAERGRRGRRAARRAAERGAGDDVHRLAGPAADDPEHVQDRRRADRRRCCTWRRGRWRRRDCRSSATTRT